MTAAPEFGETPVAAFDPAGFVEITVIVVLAVAAFEPSCFKGETAMVFRDEPAVIRTFPDDVSAGFPARIPCIGRGCVNSMLMLSR
jgi:hypothetical protein